MGPGTARHHPLKGSLALILSLLIAGLSSCSPRESSELARLISEAKHGNAGAQFKLGMSYHEGLGLEQDYTKAAAWLQKAAEQDHPIAQFALGEMYLHGEGLLPDEAKAGEWIEKAAQQGYAPAQEELAVLYSNGTGVPQDDHESLKWAGKAAEQDLPRAQHHLGFLLSSKMPSKVPRDPVTACVWFELAASGGYEESREFLATLKAQLTPAQLEEVKKRVERWNHDHQTNQWRQASYAP